MCSRPRRAPALLCPGELVWEPTQEGPAQLSSWPLLTPLFPLQEERQSHPAKLQQRQPAVSRLACGEACMGGSPLCSTASKQAAATLPVSHMPAALPLLFVAACALL